MDVLVPDIIGVATATCPDYTQKYSMDSGGVIASGRISFLLVHLPGFPPPLSNACKYPISQIM
jgi:hypothetical protein